MHETESDRTLPEATPLDSDPSSLKGLTMALGIEPAVQDQDPLIGKDIGGVTIKREIAEGGMGRVYEGVQHNPRRPVAVKIIRPGYVSQEICRRFANESEVLGKLRHPYIAQIYSAGIYSVLGARVPYFVMEYVADSLPLTRYVMQHSLTTRQRLELFRMVCEAVAHGHEKGIVHRDLKPSNILVEPNGNPKVIDFGVSRSVDASAEQVTALTDVGQLVGTLQYMSPEQFTADPSGIDTRTDVYALGVILYELLTGKPPYEIRREQVFQAAEVVRNRKPVPPSRLNRAVGPDVETITDTCLQKDKTRRYSDAADLSRAVAECLAGAPVSRPRKTSSPGQRNRLFAVAGLVCGLGVAATWLAMNVNWWTKPSRFPEGAISYKGHMYFFSDKGTNQIEAKLAAEAAGGSLVVIDDREENEFVARHVSGATWIGIERRAKGWQRLSDGGVAAFFAWDRGQPSGTSGELAASTNQGGKWHDHYVSDVLRFCIEWPADRPAK